METGTTLKSSHYLARTTQAAAFCGVNVTGVRPQKQFTCFAAPAISQARFTAIAPVQNVRVIGSEKRHRVGAGKRQQCRCQN